MWVSCVKTVPTITPIFSIQKVNSIYDMGTIYGQKVFVKSGEFKSGDDVVFIPNGYQFTIDGKKFRVEGPSFDSIPSIGIAMPKSILTHSALWSEDIDSLDEFQSASNVGYLFADNLNFGNWQISCEESDESDDADEELPFNDPSRGPEPYYGDVKIERISDDPDLIKSFYGYGCSVYEYVAGIRIAYFIEDGHLRAASENGLLPLEENIEDNPSVIYKMAVKHNLQKKLSELNRQHSIHCVIFGLGLLNNTYNINKQHLMLENVFMMNEYKYGNVMHLAALAHRLDLVPVPKIETLYTMSVDSTGLIAKAKTTDSQIHNGKCFGLLFRRNVMLPLTKERIKYQIAICS